MWFILQLALGVCGGLVLFSLLTHVRLPHVTIPRLIAACSALWFVLWVVHLVFMGTR